jgi:hypothetical protein
MEGPTQLPDRGQMRRRWALPTVFLAACVAAACTCGFADVWGEAAVRVESFSSTDVLGHGTSRVSHVRTTRGDRSVLEVMNQGGPRRHYWNVIRLDLGRAWYVDLLDSTYREVVYATERAVNRRDDERVIAEKAMHPVSTRIDTVGGDEVIAGLPTRHFRIRNTVQVGDSSAPQLLTTIEDWWSTTEVPGKAILERFQALFDSIAYRRYGKAFPDDEIQMPASASEPVGWALKRPFAIMMRWTAAMEMQSPARRGQRPFGVARDSLARTIDEGEVRKIEVLEVPDRFFDLPRGLKRAP